MKNGTKSLKETKKLVLLGVFIALGTILMLVEIPYPMVLLLSIFIYLINEK